MWPQGFKQGLFNESGLLDDTPLFNLLTDIIEKSPVQRRLVVSTVDTQTGNYNQFDESTPRDQIPTVVISSASIPAVFSDRKYKGGVYMDGGTVWNTNVVSAINRCLEVVEDKSKIVVDIAICSHAELEPVESTNSTISNLLRYWNIR